MGTSPYAIAWGSAAVFFAIGGALLLHARCRELGRPSHPLLWAGPSLAALLALAGAKLHPFFGQMSQLPEILTGQRGFMALNQSGQRIAGGLVLAAVFLGMILPRLCQHRLDGWSILDRVAPLSGIAMAIGRLGCLIAGCCFGSLCDTFFCLEYAQGRPAWWNHFARGLVPEDATSSLPVHPLPFYLVAVGLLATTVARYALQRGAKDGVSFLLFVAIFCGGRLAVESFRETILLVEIPLQQQIDRSLLFGSLVGIFWQQHRQRGGAPDTQASSNEGSSSPGIPNA